MNYVKTVLKEEIVVKKIVTIYYFEFAKNYIFEGEKHDFWEMVYVDKGEMEVMADTKGYKLSQGEVIFHKPNEFHNLWANGKIAPNVIIISFECNSKAMKAFENRIACVNDFEKNLLAQIIKESRVAFSGYQNSSTCVLERRTSAAFGTEQIIKISLEHFLVSLERGEAGIKAESRLTSSVKERSDVDMIKKIISYLKEHVGSNLTVDEIKRYSKLSKTSLNVIFKAKTGYSVMEYFKMLKIEEAKSIVREGQLNFTEIAEKLGYQSIHYFSRQFKNISKMSPSEYAISVKAKI
jgi:AraC-like DNA-binding protein/quercetin dioxygenase-like cupin family protein